MRRLVLQTGVSIDGFVAGLDGSHDWGYEREDDAIKEWKLESVTSTSDYATPMNEIPKVVFSKTLQNADWPESRIARGDLAEEIAALKREPGNDLIAYGGASFASALSRERLVDEYRLIIQPAALGAGLPLFDGLRTPLHLELVEAHTYPTGAAIHVYRPRSASAYEEAGLAAF